MRKMIFALIAALRIASVPYTDQVHDMTPGVLQITEAKHEDDFSGYFIAEWNGRRYLINDDPEDLETGDYIAVIFENDVIIEYKYVF